MMLPRLPGITVYAKDISLVDVAGVDAKGYWVGSVDLVGSFLDAAVDSTLEVLEARWTNDSACRDG